MKVNIGKNMDDDSKFWIYICSLLAILILALIITIGGCCMHRNNLVTKMIISGIPPELAQMAVRETEIRQTDLITALRLLNYKYETTNK